MQAIHPACICINFSTLNNNQIVNSQLKANHIPKDDEVAEFAVPLTVLLSKESKPNIVLKGMELIPSHVFYCRSLNIKCFVIAWNNQSSRYQERTILFCNHTFKLVRKHCCNQMLGVTVMYIFRTKCSVKTKGHAVQNRLEFPSAFTAWPIVTSIALTAACEES